MIDDFEGNAPAGTNGWEVYWDEATTTRLACVSAAGTAHGSAISAGVKVNVIVVVLFPSVTIALTVECANPSGIPVMLEKFRWGIYPDTPKEVVDLIGEYRNATNEEHRQEVFEKLIKAGKPGRAAHPRRTGPAGVRSGAGSRRS